MANLRLADAGAVRAITEGTKRILEVLAAPFGSTERKDRLDQFFSLRTDFMLGVGDRRPTLYLHGFSPNARKMKSPTTIGVAEVTRIDEAGVWMQTELDDSELSTRTWNAALKGEARASTGSVNYLERHDDVTGEVYSWPIAELSVFDAGDNRVPVSDDAVVLPLRSLYDEHSIDLPDTFEAGEDKEDSDDISVRSTKLIGEQIMTPEELKQAIADGIAADKAVEAAKVEAKEAMRAEVLEELKGDPNYRSTFNIQSVSRVDALTEAEAKRGLTIEDKKENHEYIYALMNGGTPAMRVLEESEALEGGPLVPNDLYNQISAMRDEKSLVSALGITRLKTDKLVFDFPAETAGMGALAAIAEEGAYVANEPAFATIPSTLVKYGSMITVTEELASDQRLFEPWFVKAVARKWALAENLELFTFLKAGGTEGTHSATFTQTEIDAYAFQIDENWKDGAHMIMAAGTMAVIRGLLVATPRAYGEFPAFGGREYKDFMGYPTHLNSNWEAIGAGDTTLTASIVNPDAIGWVENGSLSIKVDPYGDALNGRIRYFPKVRFDGVILQALGVVHYTDHV